MALQFTNLSRMDAAGGMIIRNPDGRMGYTANDFDGEETLGLLATSEGLSVHVLVGRSPTQNVANLELTGAGIAVMHLQECTAQHFPRSD